jgi:hypothetical protein
MVIIALMSTDDMALIKTNVLEKEHERAKQPIAPKCAIYRESPPKRQLPNDCYPSGALGAPHFHLGGAQLSCISRLGQIWPQLTPITFMPQVTTTPIWTTKWQPGCKVGLEPEKGYCTEMSIAEHNGCFASRSASYSFHLLSTIITWPLGPFPGFLHPPIASSAKSFA